MINKKKYNIIEEKILNITEKVVNKQYNIKKRKKNNSTQKQLIERPNINPINNVVFYI